MMGKRTGIAWCDDTVNPTSGCDGCELYVPGKGGPCYAGVLQENRLSKSLPDLYDADFTRVRLIPGRMMRAARALDLRGVPRREKPWLPAGLPRLIFVGDLGDVFSDAVPFEYLEAELVDVARSRPGSRHAWLWLTKRPARVAEFADWLAAKAGRGLPGNVWVGTSVTGRATLSRIDALCRVPAALRFVSVEPLREEVDLGLFASRPNGPWSSSRPLRTLLHWVIIGGESDQGTHAARPFELAWARALLRECRQAGVPAFVKQLGSRAIDEANGVAGARLPAPAGVAGLIARRLKDHHGGDWSEWPDDLRVREFPFPALTLAPAAGMGVVP
jgi:protein gp37